MDFNYSFFIQLLMNGLIIGSLYGVIAMGFVLIYKSTQVVNFAQGEFLMVGAWVCWGLIVQYQIPFFLGFLLTLGFMAVFGYLLQTVVLKPLIGQPVISVIMVTVGLSMVLQAGTKWVFGVTPVSFPDIFPVSNVSIFGLQVDVVYLISLVCSLVIMGGFFYFFRFTRWGLAMRATAYDQQVAQSLP